jgi:hypothetical protein
MSTPKRIKGRLKQKSAQPVETTELNHYQQSIMPPIEQSMTACVDNIFGAIAQAEDGDELGAVTSGVAAGAFFLCFGTSVLQIVHKSRNRNRS